MAVSSNVYVEDDAPWYPLGHGLVLMYITMWVFSQVVACCLPLTKLICTRSGCIAATVGLLYLRHQNRKKASGALDEIIEVQAGAAEASDKERVFASEEEAVSPYRLELHMSLCICTSTDTLCKRVFLGDRYSGFKYRL